MVVAALVAITFLGTKLEPDLLTFLGCKRVVSSTPIGKRRVEAVSLSPSGTRLALLTMEAGDSYLMFLPSGAKTRLDDLVLGLYVRWRADGKALMVGNSQRAYLVNTETARILANLQGCTLADWGPGFLRVFQGKWASDTDRVKGTTTVAATDVGADLTLKIVAMGGSRWDYRLVDGRNRRTTHVASVSRIGEGRPFFVRYAGRTWVGVPQSPLWDSELYEVSNRGTSASVAWKERLPTGKTRRVPWQVVFQPIYASTASGPVLLGAPLGELTETGGRTALAKPHTGELLYVDTEIHALGGSVRTRRVALVVARPLGFWLMVLE